MTTALTPMPPSTYYAALLALVLGVGCGGDPDLSNKENLAAILKEAIDGESFQVRGAEGNKLVHAPNESSPYSGWSKEMHRDSKQVASLVQIDQGKVVRLVIWAKNGQMLFDLEIEEKKITSAKGWNPDGKRNATKVVNGEGQMIMNDGKRAHEKWPVKDGVPQGAPKSFNFNDSF